MAVIVLDQAIGNDDVTDGNIGIDAARNASNRDGAATEGMEEKRGAGRGCNLANAAFREHDRLSGKIPGKDRPARDLLSFETFEVPRQFLMFLGHRGQQRYGS